uniref:Aldolase_II domain-containing protein n=1 Tax=Parastrongyloides trichosuri TaxID=131310 RepID=A0A0N4ZPZ4_PARTI
MSPILFTQIMKQFYDHGWVYGSSGGMACCTVNSVIYSPSSVQKERLKEEDLFIFNKYSKSLTSRPKNENIKESACTPLFNQIINLTGLDCVIHTHSKYSNLLTQLLDTNPKYSGNIFEMSGQEMIKGIYNRRLGVNYQNTDIISIPIIDNKQLEYQLLPDVERCIINFPESSCILVKNHGFFTFGPTWQRTKIMLECCEYLFELACDMIKNDLNLIQ